jgi:hypothetical protein
LGFAGQAGRRSGVWRDSASSTAAISVVMTVMMVRTGLNAVTCCALLQRPGTERSGGIDSTGPMHSCVNEPLIDENRETMRSYACPASATASAAPPAAYREKKRR